MELRAPRNQRGDQRRSHAASHVAHEIDDSGDRIVFLRRNSDVSHQRNRHEQKSQTNHLGDAQPHGCTEADLQVNSLRGIEHGDGQGQPAEGDQVARLELRRQLAHDRHLKQQDEASGRKRKPGQLRGVTHERLQKLRHQHQAAEQQDSQHEHHQARAGEIKTLEHADVDDGRLLKPLPDHQRDQAHGRDDD